MAPAALSATQRGKQMHPKPLLDPGLFLAACDARGVSHIHAQTLWRHVTQRGVRDVRDIPGLPKALYELVDEEFAITTSRLVKQQTSSDNSTTKLLLEMQDGARIETVIMRYGRFELSNFPVEKQRRDADGRVMFVSNERATVCVSSQVGCRMGCTFCATGTMGLLSSLTAGEILEQLYHANTVEPIRNVVFMGMGEPLDNYDAVLAAVHGMTDVRRFSLSPSRVGISTVGVVPRLRQLARDAPEVGLALSLHAPTQTLRTQIVPTAQAWHIDRIVEALDEFLAAKAAHTTRKTHALIEYVLIDGVNDSETVARELGALLQGRDVLINVIPYNPTDVPHDYRAPSAETTSAFNRILRDEYDLRTVIRQELGQDVDAACGQLVIRDAKLRGATTPAGGCQTDIEDLLSGRGEEADEAELAAARAESSSTETSAERSAAGPRRGRGAGAARRRKNQAALTPRGSRLPPATGKNSPRAAGAVLENMLEGIPVVGPWALQATGGRAGLALALVAAVVFFMLRLVFRLRGLVF